MADEQPQATYAEWLAHEYVPIRGGSPEGDPAPAGGEDGGEGAAATEDGLYDLSGVAPEVRPVVESHLKEIEGRITPRLQEAAQLRKQWEPYEQAGVNNIDPEELTGLLSFAELTSAAANGDQQALQQFSDWYTQIGEELGLGGDGAGDEGDGEEGDFSEEALSEKISQAVTPLYEQIAQQEQQQTYERVLGEVKDQTAKLQQEHGLSEEDVDTVLRFAQSYEDEADPITKGLEEFQNLIARGEKGLFDKKFGQATPPEGEGAADTTAKPVTDWDEASRIARERISKSLAT
jgi:hypothetical protein